MTAKLARYRIAIVDDHPMVRERLVELIRCESDLIVCGEAETRAEALQLIMAKHPNLVLLDLNLKDFHGTELIKDIVTTAPKCRVLVISMHDESLFAERSIRAGARGYITKQEATKNVLVAIRQVLKGEIYLNDGLARKLMSRLVGGFQGPAVASVDLLSDRELQVLRLVGLGHSTQQIHKELCLEFSTIETYRARIKNKLDLKDANALLQYAIGWVRSHGQI
jgi:DNA-binding NarL/FixJ family response regulator